MTSPIKPVSAELPTGKYPFRIGYSENQTMGTVDLMVQIGGFKTQDEAEGFAKLIAEFIVKDDPSGWFTRPQ